jgi:CAAX prenyl protease-like protein
MTEPSPSPPDDERSIGASSSDSTSDPQANSHQTGALKKKSLPHGPRVFGKHAFAITAVPFLIYWGGTVFGGYLEKTRKLAPVHSVHGDLRGQLGEIEQELRFLPADEQSAARQRLNFDELKKLLDDEDAEVAELRRISKNFLEEEIAVSDQPSLAHVRELLRHFIELRSKVEEDDLDGIRELHEQYLGKQLPDPTFSSERFDWFPQHRSWYPITYTIAAGATLIAMLIVSPGYRRIPFRVTWLGVGVGIVGIFVWIGLWYLDKEFLGLSAIFTKHSRAAFNPLAELEDNPRWMYQFLAIRIAGLVLLVPVAEEFFLRGFLMRYIDDIDWDEIPLGLAGKGSIFGVIAYGVLAHPGEMLAAAAWFGLVTWLYLRTRNIWDCVVAHGITNLLLGIYVLAWGAWELW